MRLPEVPYLHTEDPALRRLLDTLTHWLKQLLKNDTINGSRIEVTFNGAGKVTVPHNLGRLPLGWEQHGSRVKDGDPPLVCSDLGWDRQTISFVSSGAGALVAWVF